MLLHSSAVECGELRWSFSHIKFIRMSDWVQCSVSFLGFWIPIYGTKLKKMPSLRGDGAERTIAKQPPELLAESHVKEQTYHVKTERGILPQRLGDCFAHVASLSVPRNDELFF